MLRVLLIDDSKPVRMIARLGLSRLGGVDTLEASSGEEGLELARTAHPDAILLDVNMPGLGGRETLAALQADPATRDIPVVFLTAEESPFGDGCSSRHGSSRRARQTLRPPDPLRAAPGLSRRGRLSRTLRSPNWVMLVPTVSPREGVPGNRPRHPWRAGTTPSTSFARSTCSKHRARSRAFAVCWPACGSSLATRIVLTELRRGFHGFAGSGTTYGYPDVTNFGRSAESRCLRALENEQAAPEDFGEWGRLLDAIEASLAAPPAPHEETNENAPGEPSAEDPLDALIVDDDEAVARLLATRLSLEGLLRTQRRHCRRGAGFYR